MFAKPKDAPAIAKGERCPLMAFVGDEVTRASMLRALCESGLSQAEVFLATAAEAAETLVGIATPRLVVVDLSGVADPLSEIDTLAEVCDAGTRVIALGDVNDIALYRRLTALGVEDYVPKPVSAETMDAIVARASAPATREHADGGKGAGKLIAVIGARGGVGASTIAVNLASMLAHRHRLATALVDLDLFFGTIALALDVEPGRGFREALEAPSRIDGLFIERAMVRASEKLSILGAEEALENNFSFDPAALDLLIEQLRGGFECVVVDLPRFAFRSQARVLKAPSAAVVVSDASLAGLRDTLRLTGFIGEAAPDAEMRVVVNRVGAARHGELGVRDFAAGGLAVDLCVPADGKAMAASLGAGRALDAAAPNSRATAAIEALARDLAGAAGAVRTPLWRRLTGRH